MDFEEGDLVEVKVGEEEDADESSEPQWLPARVEEDANTAKNSYKVEGSKIRHQSVAGSSGS